MTGEYEVAEMTILRSHCGFVGIHDALTVDFGLVKKISRTPREACQDLRVRVEGLC